MKRVYRTAATLLAIIAWAIVSFISNYAEA